MSVDCASSAILKGLVLMQTVHNNFIKERMNQKSPGRPAALVTAAKTPIFTSASAEQVPETGNVDVNLIV